MKILTLKAFFLSVLVCLVSYLPNLTAQSPVQKKQTVVSPNNEPHKKILERVEVTNVSVTVRVFQQGQAISPVQGLKKEDFKLLINGKEKTINGFFERRRKLNLAEVEPKGKNGRLFFLIFNIMDYQEDIEQVLDTFFTDIFKQGDWLMVMSNHFFFDARRIHDPANEKLKLKQMLKLESRNIHAKLKQLTQRLADMRRLFLQRMTSSSATNQHVSGSIRDEFVRDYVNLLSEFNQLSLAGDTNEYARLAEFLKEQPRRKWVLSFYQPGRFYKPKLNSSFMKQILGSNQRGLSAQKTERYYHLIDGMEVKKKLPGEDLAKLFINSSATFHTLLLKNNSATNNELGTDLAMETFVSETYYLLKTIAQETGGMFLKDDKMDKFFNKIVQQEDNFYVLTYAPANLKKHNIKILLPRKPANDYRISYDNQARGKHMRKLIKKKKNSPHIRAEKVLIKDGVLSIVVSNFQLDRGNPAKGTIKIPLRLQVMNRDSKSSFDGMQMFEIKRNQLKTARVKLEIGLPPLPEGNYQFLIWVSDPLTGKKDLAVQEITVPAH